MVGQAQSALQGQHCKATVPCLAVHLASHCLLWRPALPRQAPPSPGLLSSAPAPPPTKLGPQLGSGAGDVQAEQPRGAGPREPMGKGMGIET